MGKRPNCAGGQRLAERVSVGLIALVFLVIAVCAAAYGLVVLASAAKEILVAVIAGSASLLSAVFAYAFQRAKDIELASIQRARELEAAERRAKQENYARILKELAPFIRNPATNIDSFTTAYLNTWVSGSVEVVKAANKFLGEPNSGTLDNLLYAMRTDLSLGDQGTERVLEKLSSDGLFPTPSPAGGLRSKMS